MPESLARRCGWTSSSQQASMIAAEMESWPQPAQRVRDLALVVAARVADLVLLQGRVVELGFGEVGHAALSFLIGRTLSAATISEISLVMKRAVIGVPS